MTPRAILSLSLFLVFAAATPSLARSTGATILPAAAEPVQFYVFSFTETPVAEAAQDVVGAALGYDLTVDPAVQGVVSFRAEGWFSGDALLKDFGTALLDEDIALVRNVPGAYALIPRANVPMMLARGGVLMILPEPASARTPAVAPVAAPMPLPGDEPWWDNAFTALLIFFAGTLAGGAALLGGQTVYRRAEARARPTPLPLLLTDQRPGADRSGVMPLPDPSLVIPRFEAAKADRRRAGRPGT